ncbi:MAG: M1 family metallopeptidase [Clostridiales bacterium]|nr:M1 family metallopeptidase [Clostridiales bacterium]
MINVYYKPDENSIFGSEKLSYKNTENIKLDKIYFHLYPNFYRNEDKISAMGNINSIYPEGFNPGQIDVIDAQVDNKTVKWDIESQDKTILCLNFTRPVNINQKIEIKIDFQEKLPYAYTAFGTFNGIACFENWYPVLCVYDSGGWHKEAGSAIGEPNFSEVADYEVEINVPKSEIVASSGKCIKEKDLDLGRKSLKLKADSVRDFTWFSSKSFDILQKKFNGVTIKSYFFSKDAAMGIKAIEYAKNAVKLFSDKFGKYPYDTFSVVETYLYGGAMEYPTITSVGRQYYENKDSKLLESAVAHETSHQWWYVTVGNNEYKEPWLDEAMATYSEYMYFEKYYGDDDLTQRLQTGIKNSNKHPGDSVDKFRNIDEYNNTVYLKGAYIIDEFRKKVGDSLFIETMKGYYDKYKFKNASISDFLDIVKNVCGSETAEFIRSRL